MWTGDDIRFWYHTILQKWAGGGRNRDIVYLFGCDKSEASRTINNTRPIPPQKQEDLLGITAAESLNQYANLLDTKTPALPLFATLRSQSQRYSRSSSSSMPIQRSISEDFDAEIYKKIPLRPEVLQAVLQAIIRGGAIQVSYQSRSHQSDQRELYPTKIRRIGGRFYMRAYEPNVAVPYKDFLLYRILQALPLQKQGEILPEDTAYETLTSVTFSIEDHIPDPYKEALRIEWNIPMGEYLLEFKDIRRCDIFFLERKMFSETYQGKPVWKRNTEPS